MVSKHWSNLRFATTLILILSAFSLADDSGKKVDTRGASASFLRMPLAFEPNVGQADGQAKFVSRGAGYSLYVNGRDAHFVVKGKDGKPSIVKLTLTGADATAKGQGLD